MARKRANRDNYKRASQEKRKNTSQGKYDLGNSDVEYFSPTKGNQSLIVVPYEVSIPNHPDRVPVGDIWYRMPVKVHYSVGIEEQAYICPKTIGKRCPICEDRARMLQDARTKEERDEAWNLKPQDRELYNILDLGDEKAGVQFWDAALGNFGNLLDEEIENGQEEYDGFYDPDEPYSIEVRFKQDSFSGNKFLKASKIDFEETDAMDDDWLDDAVPLDKAPIILEYNDLNNIYLGIDGEEEGGEEPEEEKPKRGRRSQKKEEEPEPEEKPKRGRRSRKDPEPEEKPKRGRRSRKDPEPDPEPDNEPDPEPDNEPDPEPDNEPEEKPKRGRGRRSQKKEEEPEEKPKRGRGRRSQKKEEEPEPEEEKGGAGECPGKGTFGDSFDTLDECESCKVWSDCADEYDRLQ